MRPVPRRGFLFVAFVLRGSGGRQRKEDERAFLTSERVFFKQIGNFFEGRSSVFDLSIGNLSRTGDQSELMMVSSLHFLTIIKDEKLSVKK